MPSDDKKKEDKFQEVTYFILSLVVNLFICIIIGVFYISLYYNFLLPRPELDVIYPSSLDNYISMIKELAKKQLRNQQQNVNLDKFPEIEVDFSGKVNGDPSGYSENQKEILKDIYRNDSVELEKLEKIDKINVSAKGLFALSNVQSIWKGLCTSNPDYQESKAPYMSCAPVETVDTKGCPGESVPYESSGSYKASADAGADAGASADMGEEPSGIKQSFSRIKRPESASDFFGGIGDTTLLLSFGANDEGQPKSWIELGFFGKIFRPIVALVVGIILFVIGLVLVVVGVLLLPIRNVLFGCWGSMLWSKGSFSAFKNMLMLYTDVRMGSLFNWFITKTWCARNPSIGATFGVMILMMGAMIIGTWFMFPTGAISMWLSKKFDVGGVGTWAILYTILSSLIPLRLAALFIYYTYKLFVKGCINPEKPELRDRIYGSNYIKIPLRMIFILLTLMSAQRTLNNTMFTGVAVIGTLALLNDLWFFIRKIF